ncbi:MAG: hypothetical protein HC882_07740, partial [Acidobacteria bacterium]|nr:hypothetical protein [Acidobacteriota bacterium]
MVACDWDFAGRRTGGQVARPEGEGEATLFSERLVLDASDRVTRLEWSHATDGVGLPIAQIFDYDEADRLTSFEQGGWNGSSMASASSSDAWSLDEQGNVASSRRGG